MRSIHNLESSYFRTKFESELPKFKGSSGIGIISDTDPQPIVINSHLGKFAIVTVAKINNITELERDLLAANMHFSEMSLGKTNQTELIALLIVQGKNFVDGIENVFNKIKGSCSMLILTEDGIIAARDKWGRTPIVIGKKEGAYAATSESSSLPNLDYEIEKYVGPGEIIRLRADGMEQMRKPNDFGRILKKGLGQYRDELVISTKAGYDMWPGPYGNWGSRKYLMASLDQSLKRMGLEYVDIFYSHRPDPQTPIEETMGALADIVRQGKALYVGISNYTAGQTEKALAVLKEHRVPCLIHQARYSMLDRRIEPDLLPLLKQEGVGMIAFSPLAQGMLTDKYLNGIPDNSRAAKSTGHLQREQVTEEKINKVRQLNDLAKQRGQTLAEMAIAWLLKDDRVTSVLVGASSVAQLIDNLKALQNTAFSAEEIQMIENILQ